MQSIFDSHNQTVTEYNVDEYELHEVLATIDQIPGLNLDEYDVIIARGLFARKLIEMHVNKPVVEIPVHPTDIMQAIVACKREFIIQKIALIASPGIIMGARELIWLLDIPYQTYEFSSASDCRALISEAITSGANVVIGGMRICDTASQMGVKHLQIMSSKDSLWQALTAAKRAAQISRMEQEKAERLRLLLNAIEEGVLLFDKDARLTAYNSTASKLLGIRMTANEPLESIPFPQEFSARISDNQEYEHEIIQCRGTVIVFDKRLIHVRRQIAGSVITCRALNEIQALESDVRKKMFSKGYIAKSRFTDILGESAATVRMINMAKQYSATDSNILIIGQSGTGKEILTQSIHNESKRAQGPFVAVNCAAIPDALLESELMGYEPGAFTGAQKAGKPGLFELAHNGTIFLDEISEVPLKLQAKLLRVLQEREILRVGGNRIIPVNIRIIAATNRDLEQLVEEGAFREDLQFRLDVLRIEVPTLNERGDDIAILARHFIESNYSGLRLSDEAARLLCQQHWKGNIRQLFNYCERLATLCQSDTIRVDDVERLHSRPFRTQAANAEAPKEHAETDAEKARILAALEACRYNRSLAAQQLQMDRSTLWRKMKTLGI